LALEPPAIPIGMPSDVLERRPDVAVAERQMAAQNAQIGVAKSAFYPSIGIAVGGGVQSRDIAQILNVPSTFWALGANVAETVFNGGKLHAQLDFAKSAYGNSVDNYSQIVMTGFPGVEGGHSGISVL